MSFLSILLGLLSEKALAANPAVWGIYCESFGSCGAGSMFLADLMGRVATVIFELVGGGAVLAVLYGSVRLIMGGEGGKEEAKKVIQYALGGLILAIMGWSIVWYVENIIRVAVGS